MSHAQTTKDIPLMITYTVQHWKADARPFAGSYRTWRMAHPSFDASLETLNVALSFHFAYSNRPFLTGISSRVMFRYPSNKCPCVADLGASMRPCYEAQAMRRTGKSGSREHDVYTGNSREFELYEEPSLGERVVDKEIDVGIDPAALINMVEMKVDNGIGIWEHELNEAIQED